MVCPCLKHQRSGAVLSIELNLGRCWFKGAATKIWTAWQRGHPRVTRINAGTFRWQAVVHRTSPDDDPMRVIAGLRREPKSTLEGSASLQFQCISAFCTINRGLEVISLSNDMCVPWGWRVREGRAQESPGQLRGTIELLIALTRCISVTKARKPSEQCHPETPVGSRPL